MGLTNVTKLLALACPPPAKQATRSMAPTPPIVPSTATLAPAPSTPPTAAVDEHRLWLDGLSLHDRLRYDRTFGHAWFAGNSKEQCSAIARKAVEGSRHVGAGSNLSLEAEQVCDRAPGALASSRPSALSPVPALFASSACPQIGRAHV